MSNQSAQSGILHSLHWTASDDAGDPSSFPTLLFLLYSFSECHHELRARRWMEFRWDSAHRQGWLLMLVSLD